MKTFNNLLDIGIMATSFGLILVWIAKLLFALIVLSQVTGCFRSAGWSFEVGVHPVNAVDNHSTLNTRDSQYNSKGDYQNERHNK